MFVRGERSSTMERYYRALNKRYFRNKLARTEIIIRRGLVKENKLGRVELIDNMHYPKLRKRAKYLISLSPKLIFSLYHLLLVLLHEMAHVSVDPDLNAKFQDHGRKWQNEMKRLARIGAFRKYW